MTAEFAHSEAHRVLHTIGGISDALHGGRRAQFSLNCCMRSRARTWTRCSRPGGAGPCSTPIQKEAEWCGLAWSQRGEDHEYLVAVLTWRHPQCAWPAAYLSPAEPGIKTLQSHAAPRGKVQLFQTHLLPGDLPGRRHQRAAHPLPPESGKSLQMADRAPMSDDPVRVTLQVHPASKDIASMSDDKPAALSAKTGDEVIGYRRDDAGINGREREPSRPSSITDHDPAGNEVLPKPRTNLAGIEVLAHHRDNALAHTRSLTGATMAHRDTRS
jgi:hypothetical protein